MIFFMKLNNTGEGISNLIAFLENEKAFSLKICLFSYGKMCVRSESLIYRTA